MRNITNYPYYEVNYLQLGDADSIILAYKENAISPLRIALIDAGNVGDAETIQNEIWNNWHRRDVDIAVLTHPDKDHKGGFFGLLQSPIFTIREFWMFFPWRRHTSISSTATPIEIPTFEKCYDIYNHPTDDSLNLLQLIGNKKVVLKAVCKGFDSALMPLKVVGPTSEFADRNSSVMVSEFKEISDDEDLEAYVDDAQMTEADARSVIDTEPDDTSATNMSSLILLFNPGRKFLLTGDASRASLNAVLDENPYELIGSVLKVPHHGSKHNLNTEIIDRLQPQQSAICCAGTKKHPNSSVVYWLSKYGNVYSTHKNSFYYHSGPSISAATPLKEKIH